MPDEYTEGAHGTTVSDRGSDIYEALKRRTRGFVSPHTSGLARGEDMKRYSNGLAYDFGNGGMQIRAFGPEFPHEPNSEPPMDVILDDGRILKAVVPEVPAGAAGAALIPGPPSVIEQHSRSINGEPIPDSPFPQSAPVITDYPSLVDSVRIAFITDIGPFECRCVSATISQDMWITLIGNHLPRVEPGKRFNIEIDGKRHNVYAPGISVDIKLGPYNVRVSHYLIETDEKPTA